MYILVVTLLMLVMPLSSVAIESGSSAGLVALLLKWFVFWGVGVRLAVAGLRQTVKPALTAELLGIKSSDANFVIRELGFANLAIGSLGIASLSAPAWLHGAALAGAIFYALVGIQHVLAPHRTRDENVAMVSDLAIAIVLAALLVMDS